MITIEYVMEDHLIRMWEKEKNKNKILNNVNHEFSTNFEESRQSNHT